MDSNHRTLAGTDLQSVAFSHSATYPYLIFKLPLTRFELVASPLPRECATPAPQRLVCFFSDATQRVLSSRKKILNLFSRQSPCATKVYYPVKIFGLSITSCIKLLVTYLKYQEQNVMSIVFLAYS